MKKINLTVTLIFIFIITLLMNIHLFSQEKVILASNISKLLKETPSEFKVYQNFPNPCYNTTSIKFDIASQADVKLIITDKEGNIMKCYLYNNIKPGNYQIEVDASSFNTGEYIYTFLTGDFSQSYLMKIIK